MSSEALQKAIQIAGSQQALAKMVGKTQGHVSQWLRRGGRVPPNLVLRIEKATGVDRKRLRPDLFDEDVARALPPECEGTAPAEPKRR